MGADKVGEMNVQMLCGECNQWKDMNMFPDCVRRGRRLNLCIKCLVKRDWQRLKQNVSMRHYHAVANYKMHMKQTEEEE